MKNKLLNRAKSLGCNVYQNHLGQWVIKGLVDKKMWVLQEEKPNAWVMTFDEISQMTLETEKTLEALDLFIKYKGI